MQHFPFKDRSLKYCVRIFLCPPMYYQLIVLLLLLLFKGQMALLNWPEKPKFSVCENRFYIMKCH